jgi:hypothetical protein
VISAPASVASQPRRIGVEKGCMETSKGNRPPD